MNMMVRSAAAIAVVPTMAQAAPNADARLFELEEQIFEQHAAKAEYDPEIDRLGGIVRSESDRLYKEMLAEEVRQGSYLTPQERWDRVSAFTESQEYDRLCDIQHVHLAKMEDLIRTMWATPALTPEGRRAKVLVLLGCIMPVDWREIEADWGVKEARDLLIEFIGGEPGEQLRDQFAA